MVEDPAYITQFNWADLGDLLVFLWLVVVPMIAFAGCMLLAHAIIPSLAASGDLPDKRILKLRPLLYLTSAMLLTIVLILVLALLIPEASVLGEIYERWWI